MSVLNNSISFLNSLDKTVASVFIAIAILVGFYFLARVLRKLAGAAVARSSTEGHIDFLVGTIVYYVTLLFGLVTALSRFVQVGALVASLGLSSVAVGFAIKDVLGNFLAGLMILAQRPFTIGDSVEVAGVTGKVHAIRVRDTSLKTAEGKLVLIPSTVVFNSIVTNNSVFRRKRQSVLVTVNTDMGAAELTSLARGALTGLETRYGVSDALIIFGTIGPDGLELEIRFFIDADKAAPEEAKSALVAALFEAIRGEATEGDPGPANESEAHVD